MAWVLVVRDPGWGLGERRKDRIKRECEGERSGIDVAIMNANAARGIGSLLRWEGLCT